jgi:acyl-CoA thioester hydrolase
MTVHHHTIRVRYGESDQMGVAHHAAYVSWFEECRIEMMRSLGSSYRDLESQGVLMPVVELKVRYRRSLCFDDLASFATTAHSTGPSRIVFTTVVSHGEEVCAEASVTVAATTRDGRPQRIPAALVSVLARQPADAPAPRTG